MMAEVAQRYGPYTCVRRLGVGGMAETFLAVQHGTAGFEQRVCMKFMLPALRSDRTFRQMFLREATIAASLRHSNIVGVIDVDDEAGYIVLELVDGVDLRRLVDAAPNRTLPAHLVSLVAVEMCKALSYAHTRTRRGQAAGIVHRDISPSNVLVSHAGEIKLTDFGVAKAMHGTAEPPSTGIKGKLCYMSPEQIRGEPLDGRSDLFSLGVMLYELLTGKRPFDGPSDAQTLLRIEAGKHAALVEVAPEVPGGMAMVVERMLRRNPEHRFPEADAIVDALTRFAPPITAFRELGSLARSARPPETLSTADFDLITPGSGPRPLVDLHEGTLRAPAPPPNRTLPRPALHLAGRTEEHEAVPVEATPLPAARPLDARRRRSRVSRTAWIALGASMILAGAVSMAWIARLLLLRGDEGSPPLTAAPPAPLAPPAATPPPAAIAETTPEPTSPLVKPDVPPPPSHSPRAVEPRQPTVARPYEAPRPPPAAEASAELRVGTVPLGQVWIDGELAGWAPVVIDLPPGVHSVAGGNTSPEVKRSVRLRAGEKRRLVLSLEDENSSEGN
jgi:eukaryotic-like serine/threonine-protein kinase